MPLHQIVIAEDLKNSHMIFFSLQNGLMLPWSKLMYKYHFNNSKTHPGVEENGLLVCFLRKRGYWCMVYCLASCFIALLCLVC